MEKETNKNQENNNMLFFILVAIPFGMQIFYNKLSVGLFIDLGIIILISIWRNRKNVKSD